MKKLSTMFLILAIVFVWGCSGTDSESIAQDSKEKKVEKAHEEVVWTTFDEGLAKGVKENKNIIVDFYTDWCHWCKVMDEKTFGEKKVAAKLKERFATVRLNAESNSEFANYKGKKYSNMELTRAFQVTGFPSLAFLSPEKEIITVIPGYVPADQFYHILDFIDKECYKKKMTLEEFIKKKGECEESKKEESKNEK
ncbi:thioredoxin family protein [candidate division KSB1 bacterium]|nr:thioredoxin family protein [candidate division KSB1 bacterium]MBL7092604.1 thioredoxin family protein [candidate division KSB1 bacterium]